MLCLPPKWSDQSTTSHIVLCKFEHNENYLKSQPPVKLIKSLIINEDFSWSVHVHGYRLKETKCSALGHVPEKIKTKATLNKLLLTKLLLQWILTVDLSIKV